MKKILAVFLLVSLMFALCACDEPTPTTGSSADRQNRSSFFIVKTPFYICSVDGGKGEFLQRRIV